MTKQHYSKKEIKRTIVDFLFGKFESTEVDWDCVSWVDIFENEIGKENNKNVNKNTWIHIKK